MRRPCFALSSSCLARSRLCSAKASRGESSGGTSPARWRRGDRKGRETDACDFDLKSSGFGGGCDMMGESSIDTQVQVSRVVTRLPVYRYGVARGKVKLEQLKPMLNRQGV